MQGSGPSCEVPPSTFDKQVRNLPFVPYAERQHDFLLGYAPDTGSEHAALLRDELSKLGYRICPDASDNVVEEAVSNSCCLLTIVTAGIMDIKKSLRMLRFGMLQVVRVTRVLYSAQWRYASLYGCLVHHRIICAALWT